MRYEKSSVFFIFMHRGPNLDRNGRIFEHLAIVGRDKIKVFHGKIRCENFQNFALGLCPQASPSNSNFPAK